MEALNKLVAALADVMWEHLETRIEDKIRGAQGPEFDEDEIIRIVNGAVNAGYIDFEIDDVEISKAVEQVIDFGNFEVTFQA